MKQWWRRFLYFVDGLAVVYWLGYCFKQMIPAPYDCHCCALIVPPEWVISMVSVIYSVATMRWIFAFWMFIRCTRYCVNVKPNLWSIWLCCVFGLQSLVQGIVTLLFLISVVIDIACGKMAWIRSNWQDFLFIISCLPAAILVIVLNRKYGFFKDKE